MVSFRGAKWISPTHSMSNDVFLACLNSFDALLWTVLLQQLMGYPWPDAKRPL